MLRWLLRRNVARFERRFDYDASYSREVIDNAPAGLFWLFLAGRVVRRPAELPVEAWCAAMLVGGMEADCGPCAQLGVRMAQQQGVADDLIRAIVAGDEDGMSDDVRLVARYTRAALRHEFEADAYRREIARRWGDRALVRLAYLVTVSGLFPMLKYALGHGMACTRVRVGGREVAVSKDAVVHKDGVANQLVPQAV